MVNVAKSRASMYIVHIILLCVCVYSNNILYGNLSHTRHAEVEMVCERYSTITYTQTRNLKL